uniref:protein-tyrosine-phosphatase n=1 Tax=Hucho hucho TaxID=62062 RepID=A0A4W5RIJ2_9TELE
MINTVNDFWQMAWQEDCPAIIMITKLREKNEKCVLYWPERRGIYGRVEVLINNVTECDNYTCRTLILKVHHHLVMEPILHMTILEHNCCGFLSTVFTIHLTLH